MDKSPSLYQSKYFTILYIKILLAHCNEGKYNIIFIRVIIFITQKCWIFHNDNK